MIILGLTMICYSTFFHYMIIHYNATRLLSISDCGPFEDSNAILVIQPENKLGCLLEGDALHHNRYSILGVMMTVYSTSFGVGLTVIWYKWFRSFLTKNIDFKEHWFHVFKVIKVLAAFLYPSQYPPHALPFGPFCMFPTAFFGTRSKLIILKTSVETLE